MAVIDPIDQITEAIAAASSARDASEGEGSAGPAKKKENTWKDFEAMIESTPLFMTRTPEEGEDNEVLEALRTLKFEGDGDEVAGNLKNHGNELHAQKSYREAVQAYTQGLDAGPEDLTLRISLLNNRAACNLLLKNHGAVLRDVGVIIALSVEDKRPVPPKAMYRAAQSLIALERWTDARDCVARGRALPQPDAEGKNWQKLQEQVEAGQKRECDRVERKRREAEEKLALRRAIVERGLVVLDTSSPPDNPHPLHFDPSSPGHLIFPVFLLYPQYSQSDLITHFHETASFADQLGAMFPHSASPGAGEPTWAPWDEKREYYGTNLVVYVETRDRRLLKVGKELSLAAAIKRGVKETDGVVLRDGLMSFVVLPKSEEKAWVERFKQSRDRDQSR